MTIFVRRNSLSKINKKSSRSATICFCCDYKVILTNDKFKRSLFLTLCLSTFFILRSRGYFFQRLQQTERILTEKLFVHYVWIENRVSTTPFDLKILQYASVVSAIKQLSPVTIYLHTNAKFNGPYWDAVKNYITIIPIQRILTANGRKLIAIEQEADLFKLKAAAEYGGFLADFDIYFIGPRSQLMNWLKEYDCVFGKIFWKGRAFISSGGFACRPNTDFVKEWLNEYENNYRGYCGKNPIAAMYNACVYPMKLHLENTTYQKTIHFADEGMYTYYGEKGAKFRHEHVDNWKRHFYIHNDDDFETHELTYSELFERDSSFGQMFRDIVDPALSAISIPHLCYPQKPAEESSLYYMLGTREGAKELNDLTNAEYVSIFSALKNVEPKYLIIHSSSRSILNGPLIIHLAKSFIGTQLQLCFNTEQKTATVDSTQVVKTGSVFLRRSSTVRSNGGSVPTHKKEPLYLSEKELQKKSPLLPQYQDIDMVIINNTYSNKLDLSFTKIRESPMLFAQLQRLVLYSSPNTVKEHREISFSCNFD